MAVLRCRMCGAHLKISKNTTNAECEYCGTVHVFPWSEGSYISAEQFEESDKAVPDKVGIELFTEEEDEEARKKRIYDAAEVTMNGSGKEAAFRNAAEMFSSIRGFKDADELAERCFSQAEAARKKECEEAERKRLAEERENQYIFTQMDNNSNIKKMLMRMVCVIVAVWCLRAVYTGIMNHFVVPQRAYNHAKQLLRDEYYMQAYHAFAEMDGYKDSEDYVMKLRGYFERQTLQNAEPGDYVYFGAYEQDEDKTNGQELIQWLVLDKTEDKIFVISKNEIDYQPYHEYDVAVTWEECTLRQWMNDAFIKAAFTEEEQTAIQTTTIINPDNADYGSEGGNDTSDKVFVLSYDEMGAFLMEEAVGYEFMTGCYEYCWLRTPGTDNTKALINSGTLLKDTSVAAKRYVRPAMWIDISGY